MGGYTGLVLEVARASLQREERAVPGSGKSTRCALHSIRDPWGASTHQPIQTEATSFGMEHLHEPESWSLQ